MRALLLVTSLLVAAPTWAGVVKGQRAPEFSLPALKGGQKVSLAQLRGKVVVLDFWAEWCGPCKQELPELEKIAKEYEARGVTIVTVSIDKDRGNAEKLMKQFGLASVQVLHDPNGSVAATYDLPKMPTSFVIDKKGFIRFIHEGFEGSADVKKFKQELDELTK